MKTVIKLQEVWKPTYEDPTTEDYADMIKKANNLVSSCLGY